MSQIVCRPFAAILKLFKSLNKKCKVLHLIWIAGEFLTILRRRQKNALSSGHPLGGEGGVAKTQLRNFIKVAIGGKSGGSESKHYAKCKIST